MDRQKQTKGITLVLQIKNQKPSNKVTELTDSLSQILPPDDMSNTEERCAQAQTIDERNDKKHDVCRRNSLSNVKTHGETSFEQCKTPVPRNSIPHPGPDREIIDIKISRLPTECSNLFDKVSHPHPLVQVATTIRAELTKLKQFCLDACKQGNISRDVGSLMKEAVAAYNCQVTEDFYYKILSIRDIAFTLVTTIPYLVDVALDLPLAIESTSPLLRREQSKITLTRRQVFSLLANAFFCTFTEPINKDMSNVNFNRLFHWDESNSTTLEKLKCILSYFQFMCMVKNPTFENELLIYERKNTKDGRNENQITPSQVVIANKYIGGEVLSNGTQMQEIKFAISPELIISQLFTKALKDDEVLLVTGSQQFSKYIGYANTFHYYGSLGNDLATICLTPIQD